jgi:hypothetical protein
MLKVMIECKYKLSFKPFPLYPLGNYHHTVWLWGWMDHRAGLHIVEQKNISSSAGNWIIVIQPLANNRDGWAILFRDIQTFNVLERMQG